MGAGRAHVRTGLLVQLLFLAVSFFVLDAGNNNAGVTKRRENLKHCGGYTAKRLGSATPEGEQGVIKLQYQVLSNSCSWAEAWPPPFTLYRI